MIPEFNDKDFDNEITYLKTLLRFQNLYIKNLEKTLELFCDRNKEEFPSIRFLENELIQQKMRSLYEQNYKLTDIVEKKECEKIQIPELLTYENHRPKEYILRERFNISCSDFYTHKKIIMTLKENNKTKHFSLLLHDDMLLDIGAIGHSIDLFFNLICKERMEKIKEEANDIQFTALHPRSDNTSETTSCDNH